MSELAELRARCDRLQNLLNATYEAKAEVPYEVAELEKFLFELRTLIIAPSPQKEKELVDVLCSKSIELARFHAFVRGMRYGL